MAVDAYEALKDFISQLVGGNEALALQYADDPNGTLAEQGITDGDLSGVDMYQLVEECAAPYGGVPGYGGGSAPAQYPVSSPPPAHAGHTSTQEVVQHLNYVTYSTYEDNSTITQQLINYEDNSTNIDNSVDVDVDGDFEGDIETTNVNATGDGAVAAGDDVENAATGDGAQIIDGDNTGNANTGDGAVQAGDDINAPVNTGEFTGVQAEDVDADNSVFNFGDGDVTNFGEADIDDSAVSVGGGDASNISDIEVDEGGAFAAGDGDAEGNFAETDVDADNSLVNTEQGPGNLEQELEVEIEVEAGEQEAAPIL